VTRSFPFAVSLRIPGRPGWTHPDIARFLTGVGLESLDSSRGLAPRDLAHHPQPPRRFVPRQAWRSVLSRARTSSAGSAPSAAVTGDGTATPSFRHP